MKRSVFPVCSVALAALVGISACGGSSTPGSGSTATTTAPASAQGSVKGVPLYTPSTVHSKTDTTATLTSPDPVTKVSNFYVGVINRDGWTTVSKSLTQVSGNLTIKKAGQGATISVAPSGSGSLVHISAYPTG